jgi:hypothetical protein
MALSRTLRLMLGLESDPTSTWGRWAWIPDRKKQVLARLRDYGRSSFGIFYGRRALRESIWSRESGGVNSAPTPKDGLRFWKLVVRGFWRILNLKLHWLAYRLACSMPWSRRV